MNNIIKEIIENLLQGNNLVLTTIIKHKGSTPRETGTRFIIKQDGSTVGTIGGGFLESDTTRQGLALFETKKSALIEYDMSQQEIDSSSMICGGSMTVLLEYLEPGPEIVEFYTKLNKAYEEREKSILIVRLWEQAEGGYTLTRSLVYENGDVTGDMTCDETFLQRIRSTIPDSNNPMLMAIDDDKYWVEPLLFPKKLILFGAGHVARATARLGVMTGFQTIVVDDRMELLSKEFFPAPVELVEVKHFENCFDQLQIAPDCFLVILTRSHGFDKVILSQALQTDAAFIGMIGSKRKRNTIFQSLLSENHTQEDLDRVSSPIGLDIGACTPEEIAVSIIAQLIQIRANPQIVALVPEQL